MMGESRRTFRATKKQKDWSRMPETLDETFYAFTTYLHFVKDQDFDPMYADLKLALSEKQIDPIAFRVRILEYIQKIVREAPDSLAQNGIFFNRYRNRLQRTADTLQDEFG